MTQAKQIRDDTRALVRDGRAAMSIWGWWRVAVRERGWPDSDTIERAAHAARTATNTTGIARRRGKGPPPPQPKETKRRPSSRIPHGLDPDTYALMVNRVLLDMDAEGSEGAARLMRFDATSSAQPLERARDVGMPLGTYNATLKCAHSYLAGQLRMIARARRLEADRLTVLTERRA